MQKSGFWTTAGSPTGHQVVSYDQTLSSLANEIIGACHGKEGVAPSELNALNASQINSTTVRIATGRALVDGKWYENDANEDITIPLPSADSRIDRIVLRATWGTTFTVVLHRIAGAQSSSPTAPAITQTSGTTYDILLWQVLTNAGTGIATITDERQFAQVQTAGIADGALSADAAGRAKMANQFLHRDKVIDGTFTAGPDGRGKFANGFINSDLLGDSSVITAKILDANVTTDKIADLNITSGKIAANSVIAGKIATGGVSATAQLADDIVDDTKVGNRVPQFYRRQGGDASNWATTGTTSRTPGMVRMQGGAIEWTGSIVPQGGITITFPVAFSNNPLAFATTTTSFITLRIASISTTQVEIFWYDTSGGGKTSVGINWLAIGPE
jgi:hypothetical protein